MQTISHPDVVVRTSRAAVAWLDLAMHAAVIVVLAGGAVKGWKGFVGTQIIPVGLESATVYEADSARDVPLGFTIAVTDQQKVYYPHQVRIGVSRAATGEKLRLLELREGQTTRLPGEDLEITPGRDPGERPGRCRRVAGAQRAGEPPGNEPLPDRLGRRCSGLGACCSA